MIRHHSLVCRCGIADFIVFAGTTSAIGVDELYLALNLISALASSNFRIIGA